MARSTSMELDSQPKTIQSIYSWYSNHKLYVNRRYQRKLVWSQHEKQKLVESVLKKFPVPAILLAERTTGDYEIIDGLQRLHALVSFVENSFPTLEDNYFDTTEFPTAKGREEDDIFRRAEGANLLGKDDISIFLDYSMAISIMRGATEDEINNVFDRINTYGHRLSDQERRQAGVQDRFSNLVREIACEIRGDASSDTLELANMPSISIDLPMSKHGYGVNSEEVFWTGQGILRSTDLRDSMDEQCLADIAASVVLGEIVDRSKEKLDRIYESESPDNRKVIEALSFYGDERLKGELKYCIDEVLKVCDAGQPTKLRDIVFKQRSTNPFASAFAVIVIALHETLFSEQKKIADYSGIKSAITGVYSRIETSRKAASPDERRRNVNTIKGLIGEFVVDGTPSEYKGSHSTTDIDNAIRRSEIETPHYELKQGLLNLDDSRQVCHEAITKVLQTICAIANNGPSRTGTIVIGVADKCRDKERIEKLDDIEAREVGKRFVVGVKREARVLNETPEGYFSRWKDHIRNTNMSEPLKSDVLSSMDHNDYYGLGVIVIHVPSQAEISTFENDVFFRSVDETKKATTHNEVIEVGKRFR